MGLATTSRPSLELHADTNSVMTQRSLWQRIKDAALTDVAVIARGGVDGATLERLEALLLEADFGIAVTVRLLGDIERRAKRGEIKTQADFAGALREGVVAALRAGNSSPAISFSQARPTVILVLGINGAGKTTFVGKLSARLRAEGRRVLVAAGDTFRAGAVEQLRVWAKRTGADFISGAAGGDPAAVAFNAIEAGAAREADVVLVDTAGRLHTSDDLMEELRKLVRVMSRRLPGSPHESLLVLDGTIGQNAVSQARAFATSVPVTGLVVTKLDGTASGGVVVAVHEAIGVPVKFVSNGEGLEDLSPFDAVRFAQKLFDA